jgi:glycosyltransferase involved in cell wall biosynthesis
MSGRLRIGVVVPPMLPVPPAAYGGTERVVENLVAELHARGHHVTLFASGDSKVDCELVPIAPQSLWSTGYRGDVSTYINKGLAMIWDQHDRFDIIHSHVETLGFLFARHCPTPVVTTLHGRLDLYGIPELLNEFTDIPLVAISDSQRQYSPGNNWAATIHHGLDLSGMPWESASGDYLTFLGRITPEKGVDDAIEVARRTGLTLKVMAKVYDVHETVHFDDLVRPAIEAGIAEYLGELGPAKRDPIIAGGLATLMLGDWPEPFGLVAIESMATGTPVIARPSGGLAETVEPGLTGFLVNNVDEAVEAVAKAGSLDREQVRSRALERFSRSRMVDDYEVVYERLIAKPERTLSAVAS